MKKTAFIILSCVLAFGLGACHRSGHKEQPLNTDRIVCVSKQLTEMIFALGAQDKLVGTDLSSTFPEAAKKLTKVGYHRLLSAEGIISLKPTVVFHDGNIAPAAAIEQVKNVGIPMLGFGKTKTIDDATKLIDSLGLIFHKETAAKLLNEKLLKDMAQAEIQIKNYKDKPKVVIVHYGQQMNNYMAIGQKSTATKMLEWAGAVNVAEVPEGMKPLSPELIAKAQPDIILVTDFGYDRLGSIEKIKQLPGIALTPAAKNNKIFRIEEYDLIYLGPRTGENVLKLGKLVRQ
ncbi:ABC transporter substrate-binding protein [Solitalea sp. MAHUQ-68]|uniref:ABC transporter substrate-binding protein n=1 Tax=Solitalea agri TaxID=2953739 RepID=A0A9X2F4L7_9SPHI|nr:ABC transporter substrate-binding protein [Solitalea agri]MCO4294065.1 ABC transporter substrate-binding protein [Solitalea agri]